MRGALWRHPALWACFVLTWAIALYVLSSRSSPGGLTPPFPHFDKVAHLLYFSAGSLCFGRALSLLKPGWSAARIVLICVLFAALVGVLDEYHQSFTPGRNGNDLGDMLADTLGGLCGGLVACFLRRKDRSEPFNR